MIDSEVTWKIHIDYVYCKLMKFTSIFYRLQHNVNYIQGKNFSEKNYSLILVPLSVIIIFVMCFIWQNA